MLDGVNCVVFDFDDTLGIHKTHHLQTTSDELSDYMFQCMHYNSDFINECEVNEHLRLFMQECVDKNITLGLCSGTISYVAAEAQAKWVYNNYGFKLVNYCVASQELKLHMYLALIKEYGKILVVEDNPDVVNKAWDLGYNIVTPMQIVNYIEIKNKRR